MGKALAFVVLLCALRADAGTEQLALSSQIQYSRVIQGATDPITAFVYNNAPSGSDTGNYRVTAAYAAPGDTSYTGIGYSYTGSVPANGGTLPASMSFPINTTTFTPGTVAVTVTGTDTDTGGVLTQGGQFTVLAHANPALVVNGQIVYLTSANVVKFQTNNNFAESTPGGTEATASANPAMMGDPPGEPTAELDLDSITSSGSAYLTTTLHTFTDLPANDNPAEALPFEIDALVPGVGDYSTTFTLHYSDEDDLPGAAAPGSEALSFAVEANFSDSVTDWTITTVPEPSTLTLLALGAIGLLTAKLFKKLKQIIRDNLAIPSRLVDNQPVESATSIVILELSPMKRFVSAIFLIVTVAFTMPARADVLYGDIAGNIVGSGYGVGTGVNTYIAEGFTMTGTYNLQSVDVILSLFSPASGSNLALSIFNDNGGTPGNSDLYDLSTNVSGSTGTAVDANFTGSGSYTLTAGTTYWLEMYATNPSSPTGTDVQWDGEFAQVTPTTVFATPIGPGATEVGQIRTYNGSVTTSELRTAFQLNGVAAPEPSTLTLLALGGLSFLVAARRR